MKFHSLLFSSVVKVLFFIMLTGGLCASCSNDNGSNFQQGIFADSPVQGITYSTPSINGDTDKNGTYFYRPGEVVKFSIAGVQLGSAIGASLITPVDLVMGAVDETDATVTNIARFLL